jgi:hypothetical protein
VQLAGKTTLRSFSVAGVVSDAVIQTNGNVGRVTLGAMERSSFFAGVDERPETAADFESRRTIESFRVRGVAGVSSAFVDSEVAAARFEEIRVRGVQPTSSDGEDFGFVADAVAEYNRDRWRKPHQSEGAGRV